MFVVNYKNVKKKTNFEMFLPVKSIESIAKIIDGGEDCCKLQKCDL